MALVTKSFSDIITFTRASTATYFDSTGTLQIATTNTARFDFNPSTLAAQGLLIEEQRTNSIRNNTMQGAVAGTPGTLPTTGGNAWFVSAAVGLATNVIGTGVSAGITYIDVQLVGTATGGSYVLEFEPATGVAGSAGQTWTNSFWLSQVGGTTNNITGTSVRIQYRDSANVPLATGSLATATLSGTLTRSQFTSTAPASTAFVRPAIQVTTSAGAVDITLRIGLPQLELGAFATSVIPTTTTALPRSPDVALVNPLSPWYNSAAGTLYAEFVWEGLKSTSGQAYAQFDDGSTNNRIVAAAGSSNANIMTTTSGGTSDGSVATPATVFAANTIYKTALALAANDLQSFVNGTAGTADTTVTLPVGLTNFKLGASLSATANVWLRRATYYPRRLSQAEGIAITA